MILSSIFNITYGQLPSSNFTLPSSACKGETLNIVNSSANVSSTEWDFCAGDLASMPTASNLVIAGSSKASGLAYEKDGNVWYGFQSNQGSNKLSRLDFGTSLDNTPTVTDLGTFGGVLNGPESVKLIKEGSNWYGILLNGGTSKLVRLSFGSSLSNTPTAVALAPTVGAADANIRIINNSNSIVVAVATFTGNSIALVNFGTSITNNPASGDVINTPIPGASLIRDIAVIKENDKWYGLAVCWTSKTIHRMEFGSNLFSAPTNIQQISVSPIAGETLTSVELASEGGHVYAFITSYSSGNLFKVDFGNSITNNSQTLTSLGTFGVLAQSYSIRLVGYQSKWNAFVMRYNNTQLTNIKFSNNCSANISSSTVSAIDTLRYLSSGNYIVDLKVKNSAGDISNSSKSITISSNDAPKVSFTTVNECINSSLAFSATVLNGQTISQWNWDFGDPASGLNNTATGQNATHQYSIPGTYTVKLQVLSSNGCTNFIKKDIVIYDETNPNFSIPIGLLCSNVGFALTNTSTKETGSKVNWSWDFGDGTTSTLKNPSHIYVNGGSYNITLTAGVTGCSQSISKPISIVNGAFIDFNYTRNCFGDSVRFKNNSDSVNTTSTWEIRKESNDSLMATITQRNLNYKFIKPANYKIKLQVLNQIGCTSTLTKVITVSSLPLSSILLESSIVENISAVYSGIDLTDLVDNVISWKWTFPSNIIKTGQNVSHTFSSPGSYTVFLETQTSQGCNNTISKVVTVNSSTCPTLNIITPALVCKGENLAIVNSSINATTNEWDFCAGDLANAPTASSILVSSASRPSGLAFAKDGNLWFGFLSNQSTNKLIRLDFGTSLDNTPNLVDLGTLSGILSGPESVKLIKEGGNWFGMILNGVTKKLVRLNFGSSLSNTPSAVVLTPTVGEADANIRIINDVNSVVVAVATYSGNSVALVNFGTSITNNPAPTDVINTAVSGASLLRDVAVIKECNKWYGVAISWSSRTIHRMEFGSNLFSAPTNIQQISVSPIAGASENLTSAELVLEGGHVYALIAAFSGNLYRVDFGNSVTNNVQTLTNLGNILTQPYSLRLVGDQSKWFGFSMQYNNTQLYKIKFPNNCPANISVSSAANIDTLKYSQSGNYTITFKATNNTGGVSNVAKQVTITSNDAPQISIITDIKECINSSKAFNGVISNGQTISQWNWNFGDPASGANNTSISQNPSHQFSTPGAYKVKLQVQSSNGCNNFVTKDVTIYDETVPDFPIPAGTLCSSASLTFSNTSTKEIGSHVKWLWNFGDGTTDTAKVPTHIYENGGTYNITLTAGVEGCSNVITKPITIIQGPKTGFKYQNICLGETTIFTDTTIGTGLTDWEWNFGDGNTSTLQSPLNTYATNGIYNVSLKVKNSNGCEITKTKQIKINALPVVDFQPPSVICNGDSLEFTDLSTLSDGNLSNWKWQLFNEQGTMLDQKIGKKDVKLFFPAPGKYSIMETVTSEAGCSQFATKNFDVLKAPEIDIKVTNICLGDSALLEGVSTIAGQNITGWSWEISDGGLHTGQKPKHKFIAAGKYTIYLTAISSNNCPTTVSKEVTIYYKPVANFSSSNNCLNAPVKFTDLSNIVGGSITNWAWNFGGLGTSNDQNPLFTFNKTGTVSVTLTVTSSQGCTHTISKNIIIQALPVANFSFEPEVGPPPFVVQFNNSSTGASTYKWNFGDGEKDSIQQAPVHTYNKLGVYSINLIAFNTYGCSDTLTKTIRVEPPTLIINLEKILVSTLTEELAFAVEARNTGSKIIKNIEFVIDFGGTLSFKETWSGILNPEEKITYPLRTQLIKNQLTRVKYLCINAKELNNETTSGEDNKICVDLVEQFLAFAPSPNPAQREVTFSYTLPSLPEKNAFEINFYNTQGKKIIATPQNYKQGFNETTFNVSALQAGLYTVEFVYNRERVIKRVVIYK